MKATSRMFAVVATAALVAAPAFAQGGAQSQPGQQQQQRDRSQDQSRMQAETARGQLVSVDTEDKTFTIRDMAGKSTEFKYNDETKVTGSQRGIAGLATMSGEQVTVQYHEQGTDKIASSIAVQQAATPGARPGTPNQPGSPSQPSPGAPPDRTPGSPNQPGSAPGR